MKVILLFTGIGSMLFIGTYYLLVRRYYWGSKTTKEKEEEDKSDR
jgi:hypothetical protein